MKDYIICYYVTETDDESRLNTQGFTIVRANNIQQAVDIFRKHYKDEIVYVGRSQTKWR